MRTYSPFFHTVYDQPEPVGVLGRGTHYSVLRTIRTDTDWSYFFDFAVIWDEDHDLRIVWILERLHTLGLLTQVHAIGERKGTINLVTRELLSPKDMAEIICLCGDLPSDSFNTGFETLDNLAVDRLIQGASGAQTKGYLAGIDATWQLGLKHATYTEGPFAKALKDTEQKTLENLWPTHEDPDIPPKAVSLKTNVHVTDVTDPEAQKVVENDTQLSDEELEVLRLMEPPEPVASYSGSDDFEQRSHQQLDRAGWDEAVAKLTRS